MIKYIRGNLLDAEENLICHQVNCRGVMGAGLAKQIRYRYPNVYNNYRTLFNRDKYDTSILLGEVQYVNIGSDKYICNLFGQNYYGRNPQITYTDYKALECCLKKLKKVAIKHNYSVALPYMIGCGNANGDWNIVLEIIEDVFKDYEVTIYQL